MNSYLDFLRYTLNTTSLPQPIEKMDWEGLFVFAKQQALAGILFDGIKRLPKGCRPDRELLLKWYALAEQIRKQNVKVSCVASDTAGWFAQHGFRSVILKGQGNALMYPNPYSRTPGDVDILLQGGAKQVLAFFRSKFGKDLTFCYHHIDAPERNGIDIEVHYRAGFLHNFVHNARLQRWLDSMIDLQCSNVKSFRMGDKDVCFAVPTNGYNRIYQLVHLSHHFMHEGIGLRQLVDYFMLLRQGFSQEEKIIDEQLLRCFGLHRFAAGVMWVLNEKLGLESQYLLLAPNERMGKAILDEVLLGGNFGQYDQRRSRFSRESQLGRNIERIKRDMRLLRYYPTEAIVEPFFRLWHFFWRQKYKF